MQQTKRGRAIKSALLFMQVLCFRLHQIEQAMPGSRTVRDRPPTLTLPLTLTPECLLSRLPNTPADAAVDSADVTQRDRSFADGHRKGTAANPVQSGFSVACQQDCDPWALIRLNRYIFGHPSRLVVIPRFLPALLESFPKQLRS